MKEKVKTHYLEILAEDQIMFKDRFRERIEIYEVENNAYLNFMLFAGVGLPWRWYSRLKWPVAEWENYFAAKKVKTFLGFYGKKLTGYYELEFQENNNVEIKFFGVLPSYMGKGIGRLLLSHAIKSSIDNGAKRIWLHTCSNDSKAALGNYLSRGFRIYREEETLEYIPGKDELLEMVSGFFSSYLDYHGLSGKDQHHRNRI